MTPTTGTGPRAKPLVMIICDYYLPGYESGGAMRTLVNMVDRLHKEFDFRIVTRDHDGPNNLTPYTTVKIGEWNRVGNAEVFYLSRDRVRLGEVRRLINEVTPDAVYVNSFFSMLTTYTLLLVRFGNAKGTPVVLAPEGELIPKGGLDLKPGKKKLYLAAAKALKLHDEVVWKAAAETEKQDIERVFGAGRTIFTAPNLPTAAASVPEHVSHPPKAAGKARFVFLSRVMLKKNINWFLKLLREASGDILLDVYGPVEDDAYFAETTAIIKELPKNVSVGLKGPVEYRKVPEVLGGYHFFVLPTLGENFGHIFVEAMSAGLPIIVSDRTPWRGLQAKRVGWDVPLEEPGRWRELIGHCVGMTGDEYEVLSETTRQFARDWLADPGLDAANREVLTFAMGSLPAGAA
jgi:glycosyltransferase involved in cell wall biosynthesis